MIVHSVGSGMVQTPPNLLERTNNHSSLSDPPSAAVHPFLLAFYLAGTCFCLIMAYYLDSNRRSSKGCKTTPAYPEESTKTNEGNLIMPAPGDWIRPLGNLETFMEIGGEYGSLNTAQSIWLTSKEPIDPEEVKKAVYQVALKTQVLHVCVEWRGMRPWFKRVDEFVCDFEVIEGDVMKVFYMLLHKQYNMVKGPLWGARLVPIPKESPEDNLHRAALIFTAHHCITDGHTNMTFCRDTMEVLNASMTGRVYEVPLRPVISAKCDSLMSKKDWYYVFRYFWSKMFDAIIRDYSSKLYFGGALVQPQTKVAVTKILRSNFTVDETKELIRHCKANGVTVHSCIMATANLALLQTVKQRAKYRVDAARINSVNCINMRRYFPAEIKDALGCHISLEEKEMMIPSSAAKSKEQFWSLVKVFHKNLNDSLNVHYAPIKNAPLFRPSTILLHVNYELTKRGRKNRTDNHMISTNMGNLKHILPGTYDGPVEITDILRSVSSELTGNPFTLVFQTFRDQFMISVDYYTTKMTDEAASQFFNNLVTYIGNIAQYGTVQEPSAPLKASLCNTEGTVTIPAEQFGSVFSTKEAEKPPKESEVGHVNTTERIEIQREKKSDDQLARAEEGIKSPKENGYINASEIVSTLTKQGYINESLNTINESHVSKHEPIICNRHIELINGC
ncbi:uncharacterized protein LOC135206740 [Macrobrachium nipponense]|uniref:uncharacterized protein LOC135206740 n=1 Tax=Macrobrachium nipponense TaxID=159736 RepID=UPI0030C892D9